jgi:excisionase family DNA binding protein
MHVDYERDEVALEMSDGMKVESIQSRLTRIEAAVNEHIKKMNGDGACLAVIAKSLEKIAGRFDLAQDHRPEQRNEAEGSSSASLFQPKRRSPYIDSEEAATYLGITIKSLYGQVERGHIKPLRGPRRTYRFTTEMLDEYLRD